MSSLLSTQIGLFRLGSQSRYLLAALVLLFCFYSLAANAQQAEQGGGNWTIGDIRILGLQRVSVDSVFALLPVSIGDSLTERQSRSIVRALFASGNFQNIELGLDGDVLVVTLEERPSISQISIEGNKAIPTDSLLEALEQQGMAEGRVFKRATLEGLKRELSSQYSLQGRYDAEIVTEVIPEPRNRVGIEIEVDEGSSARIKNINFVGNNVYSDSRLRELMELKDRGGLLSIFGSDRKYSREKLSGDLETIENYYLNRGYIQFALNTAQVSMGPKKESVYISISVDEGEQFKVSEVSLAGDVKDQAPLIEASFLVRPGQIFSQQLVTRNEEFIKRIMGNLGFSFAEVTGVPEIDEENKTVAIQFFVEPKKRTYVRRIEFRGNQKTRDEVLRREMRQMESAVASTDLIELSRTRLQRLGFFEEATVETVEVPGTDDLIDVVYEVKEQAFGSVSASVGFSQDVGLIFGANFQQNNFAGTGRQVGIQANRSRFRTDYSLSYVNPYYTPDGVSRGFTLFFRETDFEEINVSSFSTNSFGGSVIFGYPLSETQSLRFSAAFTKTEIETGFFAVQEIRSSPSQELLGDTDFLFVIDQDELASDPTRIFDLTDTDDALKTYAEALADGDFSEFSREGFVDVNGDDFGVVTFTGSWRESTLNRGVFATRGHSNDVSLEITAPGSDIEFFKFTYRTQWYFPVTRRSSFRLRGELGYGDGFGDLDALPFFEHFFAGGIGSVRGFESNTLGPRSTAAALLATATAVVDNAGTTRSVLLSQGSSIENLATIPRDTTPDPFGGNVLVEGSLELILPTPFTESQNAVRTMLFYDFGNVFSDNCRTTSISCSDFDLSELRSSVGISLTWLSGFGPLTFSLAHPLQDQPGDEVERFQFTLGGGF